MEILYFDLDSTENQVSKWQKANIGLYNDKASMRWTYF